VISASSGGRRWPDEALLSRLRQRDGNSGIGDQSFE
jgi:hypothetical protein